MSLSVFGWQAAKIWRESHDRRLRGDQECVCEASIEFTSLQLVFCALCSLLGGTVGGLLGSGGGFILGPLLLEIGVIPQVSSSQYMLFLLTCWMLPLVSAQVASATATFVMMFSSSLSVFEFYFLKRFPIPFGKSLESIPLFQTCMISKLHSFD